jgi:nucleotide-binding universal stress UspA family protein
MFAPKSILVPTDFSEHSDEAIKQALDIAELHHAKVHLLHVVDRLQQCTIDYCLSKEIMQKIEVESEREASRKMHEEVERILRSKKIDATFDVTVGVPYAEILKHQGEKKADLIVIGSHGRTGLLRHLIGGVAEKVVREAKCPVLLVR